MSLTGTRPFSGRLQVVDERKGKVFDSSKVTGRRVETFCIAVSLFSLSLCHCIQLEGI